MLRLTDLTLPLHHADEALTAETVRRLRVTPRELGRHQIVRRGNDGHDKANILLVYTLDVMLRDEAKVLALPGKDRDVQRTPDTACAGGILSAAVDGVRFDEAVAKTLCCAG